jgi:hypothetical protein
MVLTIPMNDSMLLVVKETKYEILHLKNAISIVVRGYNKLRLDYLFTVLGYQILPICPVQPVDIEKGAMD